MDETALKFELKDLNEILKSVNNSNNTKGPHTSCEFIAECTNPHYKTVTVHHLFRH